MPPVISSRGGTVTVVVNEAGKLECEATGVPLPSLTWLKDGSPVASVSHGIQVYFSSSFSLGHTELCPKSFPRLLIYSSLNSRHSIAVCSKSLANPNHFVSSVAVVEAHNSHFCIV